MDNLEYKWWYDKKKNMPYILFKEWNFFKSYHIKEKYVKQIKAIVLFYYCFYYKPSITR